MSNKNNAICFLCGKSKDQVGKLIQGQYGYICEECVDTAKKLFLDENKKETVTDNIQYATPSQIKAHLDEYVIGQDEVKRVLSVAVYNHYKRLNQKQKSDVEIEKSNILMIGSTGSGKTYLVQTLAKALNVPFAIADATTLTQAGYVGDDVETILRNLIQNADYDIEKAQKGIIYIDEIDKITRKSENTSITRDVSGEGVQQALLKILEGTIAEVPVTGNRKHPQGNNVKIDTSNILFICGGAFDGLGEHHNSIGFNAKITAPDITPESKLSHIEQHDIVKYGIMPELIGRLPIITTLDSLSEKDLIRILTEPRNAIVKQYQELLSMDGVELEFEDEALRKIAEMAIKKGTGARGLRSIIEKAMRKVMFEIPDIDNVKKVVITSDCVEGKADALIYGARNKKIA